MAKGVSVHAGFNSIWVYFLGGAAFIGITIAVMGNDKHLFYTAIASEVRISTKWKYSQAF